MSQQWRQFQPSVREERAAKGLLPEGDKGAGAKQILKAQNDAKTNQKKQNWSDSCKASHPKVGKFYCIKKAHRASQTRTDLIHMGPTATDDARNVHSPMRVTLGVRGDSVKPFWRPETLTGKMQQMFRSLEKAEEPWKER